MGLGAGHDAPDVTSWSIMMLTYSHTPLVKNCHEKDMADAWAGPDNSNMASDDQDISFIKKEWKLKFTQRRKISKVWNKQIFNKKKSLRLTCGTFGVLSCSGISSMKLFSRLAPLEEARMPGMASPRICRAPAPGLRPPLVVLLEMLTLSASRATPPVMRERASALWSIK